MTMNRFDRLQRELVGIQKRASARPSEQHGKIMRKRFADIQTRIREACERERLRALEMAEEKERKLSIIVLVVFVVIVGLIVMAATMGWLG